MSDNNERKNMDSLNEVIENIIDFNTSRASEANNEENKNAWTELAEQAKDIKEKLESCNNMHPEIIGSSLAKAELRGTVLNDLIASGKINRIAVGTKTFQILKEKMDIDIPIEELGWRGCLLPYYLRMYDGSICSITFEEEKEV